MSVSIAALLQPVTRRAVLAAPAILRASPAAAAEMLNVTAYDGFVPPAFLTQFEAETGTQVRIRIRLAASQAPELSLLVTERDKPLTDAVAPSAGVMPSTYCLLYRLNTPTGSQYSQTTSKTARQRTRSKPFSISI